MPAPDSSSSASRSSRWEERWGRLARTVGLSPSEPVVLALSGGADSVLLLQLLAAARERPRVTAVHVDHGLRGIESDIDALFCGRLCRELGVPLVVRRVALDPEGPSLEARARELRYRVLAREAERLCCPTLVTGHHADDGLETLLMRWIRGTELPGLAGLRRNLELEIDGRRIRVARPLISMRREEVRLLLADRGHEWREDSSNRSPRFTRNRVRHVLLPEVARLAGPGGVENLFAFGRAVEELESHLAGATAYLAWCPAPAAPAFRSAVQAHLGGSLPRAGLMRLPAALSRRALWRLILEGTGTAPGRALLEQLVTDLRRGRCTRHALPRAWELQLRAASLDLSPPLAVLDDAVRRARSQASLPFPEPPLRERRAVDRYLPYGTPVSIPLGAPGAVTLPDGRRIGAERIGFRPAHELPRGRSEVELDVAAEDLHVRWPRPGDRFHPFGAPGARALARILSEAGVPRRERARVPLVVADGEIVWVAGFRPSESARVTPRTTARLRLRLTGAAPELGELEPPRDPPRAQARTAPGQRSFWETRSG